MLELVFKNLLSRIQSLVNSYYNLSYDELISARDWDFIFSDFDNWVVLYCVNNSYPGGYWIYPMLYPQKNIKKLKKELPSYSISQPSSAYGYVISGDKHWIDPFWSRFESFESAENPIFFHRQYYGDPKGSESYYELNQLITHLFDLHWSKNKTAYCKLNDLGDEVEKIKITGLL